MWEFWLNGDFWKSLWAEEGLHLGPKVFNMGVNNDDSGDNHNHDDDDKGRVQKIKMEI